MDPEEALFIGFACALADSGAFANMSELHVVLRARESKAASDWLTDDVWFCLSSRIEGAWSRRPGGACVSPRNE